MKISKLFHWLYAILMFLPILVFIPNAFYYGFNEQAVAQEKTEQVPVYYDTNEVNTFNDLVIGNAYKIKVQPSNNGNYQFEINDYVLLNTRVSTSFTATKFLDYPYIYCSTNYLAICVDEIPNYLQLENSGYVAFVYKGNFSSMGQITYEIEPYGEYFKEYTPVTTNMSITDSMSYAWKSTWQNELFSWSYVSFLTQPFLYITNLFNVPATNTLLYCLSYWLNISIIWLCFDVVMYVPLLVHRWLDKGIIE